MCEMVLCYVVSGVLMQTFRVVSCLRLVCVSIVAFGVKNIVITVVSRVRWFRCTLFVFVLMASLLGRFVCDMVLFM